MPDKFEALKDAATACRFQPMENNQKRSEDLMMLKVKVKKSYWKKFKICELKEAEMWGSSEVSEIKLKDVKSAIVAVKKSQDMDFDSLAVLRETLDVIRYVMDYNNQFMELLKFNEEI